MQQVKLDDAQIRLPDLIEAAIEGEEVFIVKDDRQTVQLVPVELPERRRFSVDKNRRSPQFGSARGLIAIADDFDAPLADSHC